MEDINSNLKNINNLDISLNTLKYKDLMNINNNRISNNLSYNLLVISSYESFNKNINNYSYQNNNILFIDNNKNIIPLTYNVKYENGILKINNNIINTNIDDYTINDTFDLPKSKTIRLSYTYNPNEYHLPLNIIDSYSYIINSYEYITNNSKYSYEIEYNYNLYTYYDNYNYDQISKLGYTNDTYSYYIYSYKFNNEDLNISYNIKYTYNNLTYITYTYNYSYTYLINQFENEYIYVNSYNLDKANYDKGIYKSDLDTLQIKNNSLSINQKYVNILYNNLFKKYIDLYNDIEGQYNEIVLKSSLITSYAFNSKPIDDLSLLFSTSEDIIYFDKTKKIKINNNECIEINKDIDEFNICIPFEYMYISHIGEINPIDLDKLLVNVLNKKGSSLEDLQGNFSININGINYIIKNFFNYNNIFDEAFQINPGDRPYKNLLNFFYNINYNDLKDYYNINNNIIFDIDHSYIVDNKIQKYESITNKYYGKVKYVFNFKFNNDLKRTLNKLELNRFYQFDIVMFIKDSVLNNCNIINENYKLNFSFYISNIQKYIQTYDVLYHNYNVGFNFNKQGKRLGICFISENFNYDFPKPLFCKYEGYNDIIKVNLGNLVNSTNNNLKTLDNYLDNENKQYVNILMEDRHYERLYLGMNPIQIHGDVSVKEIYYSDKIYNKNFNYFKKQISITNTSNYNSNIMKIMKININSNENNNHLILSDNNTINKVFNNKSIFSPNILKQYFKEIYDLKSSGLRHGDYYIPTVNQYYMMSLYNIFTFYNRNLYNILIPSYYNSNVFISGIITTNKNNELMPVLVGIYNEYGTTPPTYGSTPPTSSVPYKMDSLFIYNNKSIYISKINKSFILPIFKLPDYSIINNGNYNIVFDDDLNYETVVIRLKGTNNFSLRVKKYLKNINSIYSSEWYIENASSDKNAYEANIIKKYNEDQNKDLDYEDILLNYKINKKLNENILYFNIGFEDSDPSLNTNKINNNPCRILCMVIIKIDS